MLIVDNLKILFYSHPVDMRKSVDSLCVLISDILHCNSSDGTLFLFRNRIGNKLKALYYETNCFTIWYRRLEKGKYIFQRDVEGKIEMSNEHFKWLLASDKYSCHEASISREISHFY